MKKAILFDFDGTLANTLPGILVTMREVFKRMEMEVPSDAAIMQTIGLPLAEGLHILGGLNEEETAKASALYIDLFPVYEVGNVSIFPGVEATLEALQERGVRMAIATSRDEGSLRLIMEPRGMHRYFETRITASDHITPKPQPDMVLTLMERMGLKAEDCLVVGDTIFDIQMGQRAGCDTVAVTYGNHSREQLESVHPTHIIDRMEQVLELMH